MTVIASASGPLTMEMLVGTIVAVLFLLVGAVFIAVGTRDTYDPLPTIGTGLAIVALTVVFWLWGSWPLAYDYHHWIPTTGTVKSVDKRIVKDGDSISEKYVIRFADGRTRALNDTIGGSLRAGDVATMRCKKAFEWGVPRESHGWDCKWSGKRS